MILYAGELVKLAFHAVHLAVVEGPPKVKEWKRELEPKYKNWKREYENWLSKRELEEKIRKLAELRDARILSEDEFQAKKAELLEFQAKKAELLDRFYRSGEV